MKPLPFLVLLLSAALAVSAGAATCDVLEPVPTPNPGRSGNFLNGVAGRAADDVWAVGSYRVPRGLYASDELPLALHWDGAAWTAAALPTLPAPPNGPSARLRDAQAFASGELWAVGSYVRDWTPVEPQTLAMRFVDGRWEVVPSPVARPEQSNGEYYAVGGVSATDFWAVGELGGFLAAHWDGSSWEVFPVPPGTFEYQTLRAVSAIATDDVWAAGNSASERAGAGAGTRARRVWRVTPRASSHLFHT